MSVDLIVAYLIAGVLCCVPVILTWALWRDK